MYSPLISTTYGQVYWTGMDAVPLPDDIVKQFAGKVMAITGYESDQVMRTPNGDVPLPITAAYNHHYTAYVNSKKAVKTPLVADPRTVGHMDSNGQMWTYTDPNAHEGVAPASAALHEGNGGEFRQSFHGYPKGFAQLVESPEEFVMYPMQIDTWNRENKNFSGFWPGPEPKNSEAQPGAAYSGLLECPCTDRIVKEIDGGMAPELSGDCQSPILSQGGCTSFEALSLPSNYVKHVTSGANASMPPGCSVTLDWDQANNKPLHATAFFNSLNSTNSGCSAGMDARLFAAAPETKTGIPGLATWVDVSPEKLRVTLLCPPGVWCGVGYNTSTMTSGTYAIVLDGHGNVSEHQLGTESPGTVLPSTLTVESLKKQTDGSQVVVVSRPMTSTASFTLSHNKLLANPLLHLIAAAGSGPDFAYHKEKSSFQVEMLNVGSPTCICAGGADMPFGKGTGYLQYTPPPGEPGSPGSKIPGAPSTKLGFKKNCLPYPESTMLLGKNPSCDIRAYTGGQSCCHHLFTLLDKDQPTPWQDTPLEYHMKFRIYYQEDPSIANVFQHNWGGMATPTEYDVPKCADGVEGCQFIDGHWIHSMNGTWTVKQMTGGVPWRPVTIHGHCHAPTCIEFNLYNADTGELICSQKPIYGQSNKTFDEKGYLSVPPCVFGSSQDGLFNIPNISAETNLFSNKTCKADAGHHGEMSLWQTYNVV